MKKASKYYYLTVFILSIGLIAMLGPLLYMLFTAFYTPASGSFLSSLSLKNFKALLSTGSIFRWVLNSLFVSFAITLSQTFFNSLAAFGFSAGKFKGREALFMLLLASMMVPGQIVMLPLFLFMSRWGLSNSLWAVILPSMAAPFGVYMVRQYMSSIPAQMLAAARIDGASEWQIFRHIYLPLSTPILATSGIFVFISSWNAFLWPLITLNTESNYTLTVGLATLQEQQVTEYGLLMAGASLAAIPMVVIFFCFSKYMLEGMRKGAIQ